VTEGSEGLGDVDVRPPDDPLEAVGVATLCSRDVGRQAGEGSSGGGRVEGFGRRRRGGTATGSTTTSSLLLLLLGRRNGEGDLTAVLEGGRADSRVDVASGRMPGRARASGGGSSCV
jgi:hypothetical protein